MPYADPEKARLYHLVWKRQWRDKNRERLRIYWATRAKANRTQDGGQHNRELQKQYRASNPEKIRAWGKASYHRRKWDIAFKRKRHIATKTRRVATGHCPAATWLQRVKFYGWCCAYCSIRLTPKTVTVDHVIPLSRGGTNWPANLVPSCAHCNKVKHNKRQLPVWLASSGGISESG